jgi:ABC-type nitrate/sulfonate/bicarbonate transport system permease component
MTSMTGRGGRVARIGIGLLSVVVVAGIWQLVGASVPEIYFATFTATITRAVEMTVSGEILDALAASGFAFLLGMGISIVLGIPFALLLARSDRLRRALEGYLYALYATPMVVFIPFLFALMGVGLIPRLIVIVLHAIFPIILTTLEGTLSTPRQFLDVASAYGSNERQTWRDVLIPYTVPFAMSGIRQAVGRGLVGTVAAEFFLSATGLGQLLIGGAFRFDSAAVLATTLVITLVAVTLTSLVQRLEDRFTPWREGG